MPVQLGTASNPNTCNINGCTVPEPYYYLGSGSEKWIKHGYQFA